MQVSFLQLSSSRYFWRGVPDDKGNERKKLIGKRKDNDDDLFMPCVKLLDVDAIVEHDVRIDHWRFQWDVQSKSSLGIEVPADIPGGVSVVGALGMDGSREEVRFDAKN